jgi:hypothetical protein
LFFTECHWRCCRALASLGDPRAACPHTTILRGRGVPLERAAATICREAGARGTTHTRVADLNLDQLQRHRDRRIEDIANGLNLCGGAEPAIDTTLVSRVIRAGQPRTHAGTCRGAAVQTARRSKERTYPELLTARRCKLVLLAIEAGGRWSQKTYFVCFLAKSKARQAPAILQAAIRVSRSFALLSHAHHNVQPNPCGNSASRLPP